MPPLFDVTLVASAGETWTVAGFERIEAGRKWSAASARAHELEQQPIGLGLVPVAPCPR